MSDHPSPRPQKVQSKASKGEGVAGGAKRKAPGISSAAPSSYGDLPLSPTQPGLNKVAIPRLHHEDIAGSEPTARDAAKVDRTAHACEPCRTRKTKCSGERPICKHCRQFNITCIYADGKRDRVRRHQEQQEHKIAFYEALLTEAGPNVGPSIWSRFQKAKSSGADFDLDAGQPLSQYIEWQEQTKGEDARSASEGSMDAVDSIGEDVTRTSDTQATGFLGKASEVDWQRNLNQKEDVVESQANQPQSPHGTRRAAISVSSMSYQTAQDAIPELSNPDLNIQETPSLPVAQHLANTFFKVVYPSFPLLPRFNFEAQLNRAYSGRFEHSARPNDRWRAIMNLVFAIGARYLKLTDDNISLGGTSHETFFARAAHLGLVGKAFLQQADLQQIQIFGLASLYLLTVNHMNRSWMLAGLALRACVALGLQVEIKSDEMTEYAKEARYRLWWAIYGLETMLQIMTGRPAAISFYGFSTPLPVPYNEESFDPSITTAVGVNMSRFNQTSYRTEDLRHNDRFPNITTDAPSSTHYPASGMKAQALADVELSDSLYFVHRARLCLIAHKIHQTLYQPAAAHYVWSQVQVCIQRFNDELGDWSSQLPAALEFCSPRDNAWDANRTQLAVFFYSLKILANRPCLCEMGPAVAGETEESEKSQEFNSQSARACIEGACAILDLLPKDGKPSTWAKNGPWWSMIHYTFFAVTVLTVAIFYDCRHVDKERAPAMLEKAKHGLNWLHNLAQEPNDGAERAWRIAALTLTRICRRLHVDLSDVPLPPEASDRSSSGPLKKFDNAASSSLAPLDADASSSRIHTGFDPMGYPSLDPIAAANTDQGLDVDPMFGYLFTPYAAPDGYPGGTSTERFGPFVGTETYFPSVANSFTDPSLASSFPLHTMHSSTEPYAGGPARGNEAYSRLYPNPASQTLPHGSAPSTTGSIPTVRRRWNVVDTEMEG